MVVRAVQPPCSLLSGAAPACQVRYSRRAWNTWYWNAIQERREWANNLKIIPRWMLGKARVGPVLAVVGTGHCGHSGPVLVAGGRNGDGVGGRWPQW